jgi:hypothetical protein
MRKKPWRGRLAVDDGLIVFEDAPKIDGPNFVNPKSSHTVVIALDHFMTPEQRTGIKEGRKSLFLWGEIQYRDAFAGDRRTWFRLTWVPTPDPRLGGVWSYCHEGNGAT